MRVMRNHRLAAYDADEYEELKSETPGYQGRTLP